MTLTQTRPAFRLPWTAGARAYPEADTFEAAHEGFKRRRKNVMFHMTNTGEAGTWTCIYCHGRLDEPALEATKNHGNSTRSEQGASTTVDKFSTWMYYAQTKKIGGGMHYICSWSNLLGDVHAQGREF